MVNILIAHNDVNYAIKLMNYISNQNKNIKVYNISTDGRETLNILNSDNYIDIIILDYKILHYNGFQILGNLKNKNKFIDSCIILYNRSIEKTIDLSR